jgi:hypothetical protein
VRRLRESRHDGAPVDRALKSLSELMHCLLQSVGPGPERRSQKTRDLARLETGSNGELKKQRLMSPRVLMVPVLLIILVPVLAPLWRWRGRS